MIALTGGGRTQAGAHVLIATAMACLSIGCDDWVPEEPGIIDVRIQDDSLAHPHAPDPVTGIAGTAEVRATVEIRHVEDGMWHTLATMASDTVDLQQPAEFAFSGPHLLSTGHYDALRISDFRAVVDVDPFNNPVTVTVNSSFVLSFNTFELDPDETRFVVVVLNVEDWVMQWDASTTAPSAFQVITHIQAFVNGPTP